MERWISYALVAAILIGSRDIFTTSFTKKYSSTQHLLHYYILCGIVILGYCVYRKSVFQENNFKMVDYGDIWKYIIVACVSVIIISPCIYESLKLSDNPGKAKAIINLNTIFAFFISYLFLSGVKINHASILGIFLIIVGIYFII